MSKTFEPTEKELKEFQSRVKDIIAKQKKIKITIFTKPKPKKRRNVRTKKVTKKS